MLNMKCATTPADSETIVIADSTYGLSGSHLHASISTSHANLAPGSFRYRWPNPTAVKIGVKLGDKAVTLKMEVLTGNAGTSSDWEEDSDAPGNGSATVTLSDTTPYEWKPSFPDWRVRILAAADNPSSCIVRLSAMFGGEYDYGS